MKADDDGTDAVVRFTSLLGLKLSTEEDAPPAFDGICFRKGKDSEDIPGRMIVLGGPCTVCVHTDRCSMVVEYALDKIIPGLVAADSVGREHDAYTPLRDEL